MSYQWKVNEEEKELIAISKKKITYVWVGPARQALPPLHHTSDY